MRGSTGQDRHHQDSADPPYTLSFERAFEYGGVMVISSRPVDPAVIDACGVAGGDDVEAFVAALAAPGLSGGQRVDRIRFLEERLSRFLCK